MNDDPKWDELARKLQAAAARWRDGQSTRKELTMQFEEVVEQIDAFAETWPEFVE